MARTDLNRKRLTFWDRLGMYADAVGYDEVATAWDLAKLPWDDATHREFAVILTGGDGKEPQQEAPPMPGGMF